MPKRRAATEREELIEQLTALVEPILVKLGLELVEMEVTGGVRHRIVRAYIHKPGGVTISDCTAVSRPFSLELDAANLFDTSYTLEVSSPGMDRPLVSPADFRRREGYAVRVSLKNAAQSVMGKIISTNGELVLETAAGETKIAFDRVEKGRLEF